MSLDELYGMLKTHDMELQQRNNRLSNKVKQVALKINSKPAVIKEKNSNYAKGRGNEVASTDESDADNESNTDDDSNSNGSSDDDMMQMMAMIVKGFKKMKFKIQRRK